MIVLHSTIFGSHLYGTNHALSDKDYKHLFLPDLDALLLAKDSAKNIMQTTNNGSRKNSVGDEDHEYIPIQIFAYDYLKGQAYAHELAWAILGNKDTIPAVRKFVTELAENFTTNNVSSVIGAISAYSGRFSASLNYAANLVKFFVDNPSMREKKMDEIILDEQFRALFMANKTKIKVKHKPFGGTEIILFDEYKVSGDDQGHDLVDLLNYVIRPNIMQEMHTPALRKSVMQSVRIADMMIEIFSNGSISFPLPPDYVAYLHQIRDGGFKVPDIQEKIDLVYSAAKESGKPDYDNAIVTEMEDWLFIKLLDFYHIEPANMLAI